MGKVEKRGPAMAWLSMPTYTQDWLNWEFGGEIEVYGRHVLSISHLPGAKALLRREVVEDLMNSGIKTRSLSVTRRNCIEAGLTLDPETTVRIYGLTREALDEFVPIECPKMAMTKFGVLRPWTWDMSFGWHQSVLLQKLLKAEFWRSVAAFDREFAKGQDGAPYPAKDMVEAWCVKSHTSDVHVEAIRREWQRQVKRFGNGSGQS